MQVDTLTPQQSFGKRLKRLRSERGLTLRDLEKTTGVSFPYISLIEAGKRGVGPQLANKLAAGLGLQGEQRLNFVLKAQRTPRGLGRSRVRSSCPAFLAELFAQHVERFLGIQASTIKRFEVHHLAPMSETGSTAPFVYLGYPRGSTHAELKPEVISCCLSKEFSSPLIVLIHADGRQSVIALRTLTF